MILFNLRTLATAFSTSGVTCFMELMFIHTVRNCFNFFWTTSSFHFLRWSTTSLFQSIVHTCITGRIIMLLPHNRISRNLTTSLLLGTSCNSITLMATLWRVNSLFIFGDQEDCAKKFTMLLNFTHPVARLQQISTNST